MVTPRPVPELLLTDRPCNGCGGPLCLSERAIKHGHRQCRSCQTRLHRDWADRNAEASRAYQRDYMERHKARLRAANKEYYRQNSWKVAARNKARYALRKGRLQRQPCETCGAHAQIHHTDYNKPLDVLWLCRTCHGKVHRGEPRRIVGIADLPVVAVLDRRRREFRHG